MFLSYVLSFIFLGIYWNNHHHLLQAAQHVTGAILWANLHLLFWLSLVPFVTAWMGENHFAPLPDRVYGVVLLVAAVAYFILVRALLARHGQDSLLAPAIGDDWKGNVVAAVLRGRHPARVPERRGWRARSTLVAAIWLVPDPGSNGGSAVSGDHSTRRCSTPGRPPSSPSAPDGRTLAFALLATVDDVGRHFPSDIWLGGVGSRPSG